MPGPAGDDERGPLVGPGVADVHAVIPRGSLPGHHPLRVAVWACRLCAPVARGVNNRVVPDSILTN